MNCYVSNRYDQSSVVKTEFVSDNKAIVNVNNIEGYDGRNVWRLTPISEGKTTIRVTCYVEGDISRRNGTDYTKISKTINVVVKPLVSPKITSGTMTGKNTIRIEWSKEDCANSYIVYRDNAFSLSDYKEFGGFAVTEIGRTYNIYFVDTFDINEGYVGNVFYYNVISVGTDNLTSSAFTSPYIVEIKVLAPSIVSVNRIKGTLTDYKFKISGPKYSRYEILYNNKVILDTDSSNPVLESFNGKKGKLYVRSYDEWGNYSELSKPFDFEASKYDVTPKNISAKKIKATQKKKTIKIDMGSVPRFYLGSRFVVQIAKDKKFKKGCKTKTVSGNYAKFNKLKKGTKYYYRVKVVINSKSSKWSKVKSITLKK